MNLIKPGYCARCVGAATLAATLTLTAMPGALAQSNRRSITLDSGTVIPVILDDSLGSDSASGPYARTSAD